MSSGVLPFIDVFFSVYARFTGFYVSKHYITLHLQLG